ncbi:hypothetical protein MKK84_19505 [Methylobacterium sp. E-065]|uniref:hypothetical protein n=1 Tax=Methylobacterium sp. E-065 TaxID=2836583 RepID=UPI001FB86EDF|nr:hypothetical protein [Methylobacterium sp. E-065]MCJ2019593.1 hypothetical protein [Methylobacterium sp. E-065]
MPLTSDQQAALSAALDRLQNFYDGDHAYNPATYPGAFRQGGSVVNFEPALKDVATVMQLASVLVSDATAASGASPKALRVDGAQGFLPSERGQGRANLKEPTSTYVYSSGNRTLSKDDVGSVFYVDSTQTITIPLVSDTVVGDTIEFYVGAGTLTLNQPSGNQNAIGLPGSSGQIVLLTVGAYVLKRHDTTWRLYSPPNNAVQRTGDTMTGALAIAFTAPYLDLLYAGVIRLRQIVDSNGTWSLRDGDSGDNKFYVATNGAVWTKQLGDLYSALVNQQNLAVNRSVTQCRQVYVGDYDITGNYNGGMVEPYAPALCSGRSSITSGDGNDIIIRAMRFRQHQYYIANVGWAATYNA